MIFIVSINCCTSNRFNSTQHSSNIQEELMLQKNKESVVIIKNKIDVIIRTKNDNKIADKQQILNFGTGFIIKNSKNITYIITARHICNIATSKLTSFFPAFEDENVYKFEQNTEIMIKTIDNNEYHAKYIIIDRENDLCVLMSMKIPLNSIDVSNTKPSYGERTYLLSFPRSLWDKDYLPILTGYYSGDLNNDSIFSIPSAEGASGGPILNVNGELVGVLHSYFRGFNNISVSCKFENLKKLINNIDLFYSNHLDNTDREITDLEHFNIN